MVVHIESYFAIVIDAPAPEGAGPSFSCHFERYATVKVRGAGAPEAGCWRAGSEAVSSCCSFWYLFFPRKEVIQPHLPVRLPCYDFTPLTLHTFDASAPSGFGRRLRVQTTRVV